LLFTVWNTEGAKVTVQLNNRGADSGEVPHTERSRWLHDHSHAVPTLTISVLSAGCAVHRFTDIYTLTQIVLPTVAQ